MELAWFSLLWRPISLSFSDNGCPQCVRDVRTNESSSIEIGMLFPRFGHIIPMLGASWCCLTGLSLVLSGT
jgi:hypothetical protein